MLVKEIMNRAPRTVAPETGLIEVVSIMCLYRISGLPVLNDGKLAGMIAEKDVLHRLFPSLEDMMESKGGIDYDAMMLKYRDVVDLKVADLMSNRVITVSPDMHILRAATVMVRHRFRRIPVAEGDNLVGMLSLGDVHKAIYLKNISTGICK